MCHGGEVLKCGSFAGSLSIQTEVESGSETAACESGLNTEDLGTRTCH